MAKTPKSSTDNKTVTKLKSIHAATLDTLNIFTTAAGSAGNSVPGASTAADIGQRVVEQVGNLFTELGNAAATAGGEVATEFEKIMNILNIHDLLASFGRAIRTLEEAAARLWIALLQEIKKILRILWELFFGALPKWLETVLLIIDELAKHAVGLMFPKLIPELNAGELSHLQEVHAARRNSLLESQGTSTAGN